MRPAWPVLISAMIALGSCTASKEALPASNAQDSVGPHYVITKTDQKPKGVILLFHQAGSNLHEYDPLVPKFNALGYDTIAVDQRSGGTMWGFENVTTKRYKDEPGYSDAYPDLVASLKVAETSGYSRIIVLGSSYSAALCYRLASEYTSVSGLMAFSPSPYLDKKGEVARWNSMVRVPTLLAATKQEVINGLFDVHEAAPRIEQRSRDILTFFLGGVHGASTLRSDKNPKSHKDYWNMVEQFLEVNFPD